MRRRSWPRWLAGAAALAVSVPYLASSVDGEALHAAGAAALGHPLALAVSLAAYAAAFGLRTVAWRRVVPSLPSSQAWAAIHVSLLGNHVLPLRLGEGMRVASVVRRTDVPLPVAASSTVALRATDVVAVVALAAALAPRMLSRLAGGWALAGALGLLAVAVAAVAWLRRLARRGRGVTLPGPAVVALAVCAWLLEAAVMHQAAHWAGIDIGFADAVAVTSVTIAAQTVAVTPGGIGSYEAAATAALVALGAPDSRALAAALTAHAIKTAYALTVGGVALFLPAPGWFGRLRLPRVTPRATRTAAAAAGPVVLFLPAHNEAASVGDVVRRVPAQCHGHPVHVIVVDDGSTDATAEVASAAGAQVVRLPANAGLGAAVRRGLREAVSLDAVAVAFCDADGEYAPEELDRLVAPILAGDADYVVGSRFAGDIGHMRPHRRAGNVVLTRYLRIVSRTPVSDGQSGYRAFSPAAAADAEIVHDYNYAQVLTLDLLAKGYRYAEVPISYSFRTTGDSFIRLGRYLRRVVPAVHAEINS